MPPQGSPLFDGQAAMDINNRKKGGRGGAALRYRTWDRAKSLGEGVDLGWEMGVSWQPWEQEPQGQPLVASR